jgi:subtilisin family serine protease
MGRRAGATQFVVASLLLVASVGAIVASPAHSSQGSAAANASPLRAYAEPAVDPQVAVTADIAADADLPPRLRSQSDVSVTISDDEHRLRATIPLSEVRTLSDTQGVAGVQIDTSGVSADDDAVSPGVTAIGAERLHDRNVTGENVTVGVIDAGFHLNHQSIADHVSAYRAVSEPGDRAHGTAVADVVSDTAPDARLHLVAVGSTTTAAEYREAVEWLRTSGADVVVDSGSYLGADSARDIAAVAESVSDDVVFVTSAGNYANRHWTAAHRSTGDGTDPVTGWEARHERATLPGDRSNTAPWDVSGLFESDGDGDGGVREWVTVDGGRRNRLGDGPISGRVTVSLSWASDADYDLYLVRQTVAGDVLWDSATTETAGGERLSVVVPRGRYAVAIGRDDGGGRQTRLELFSNRRLESSTPAGSLAAPATADGAIVVGALDGDAAAAFSSRGPTAEGRLGVDVVAPDDSAAGDGTSIAAPYVAGTVALMQSADTPVDDRFVGRALVYSATDVGPPGPDTATGHGRVDAVALYRTLDTLGALDTAHHATPPGVTRSDDR